jgi:alpha-L-fucosidase
MTDSYGPQLAFDNDMQTRWATDAGTRQAWLAVDLGKEKLVGSVQIDEAYAYRVQKFEFQYRSGQEWITIFSGQKIGLGFRQTFTPVNAREFRLNVLDATEGPTIYELNPAQ